MVGDNPYLEGALAPVPDEVLALDLPVTGTLPEELEGRWLRNGPNPLGPTDPATHHWFLGDGMVHGVRLCGGRAEWYRNRWVRGPRVAEALGEPHPAGTSFGDRDFGPNTSVGGFAGKTWAMVEAGTTPMTLTYEL
ncbi:MAG: carotenoid oxygenase family protein, partial [Actinomycetota bacterium]|nr:carotenoid oxygenase family protein [Actinomycetota bacterium]